MQRRLRCVEDRFLQGKSQVRVVVRAAAVQLALDAATCERILEECGYLRNIGGASVVMLADIPDGLDAKETGRFLRKRGAELCTGIHAWMVMNAKLRRRLEVLEETSCRLLEKIQTGAAPPKGRLPIIVSAYVGTADLRFSTCRRTLCPDGTLMEYVKIQDRQSELASYKGVERR